MKRWLQCAAALEIALLSSACMTSGERAPSVAAVNGVAAQAALQIQRCYRTPRVATVGKQIATRVRVRFQPDGTLANLPIVIAQSGVTPDNQPYAGKMAEAAGLAVVRCTPIKLPPELYDRGWSELEFTFSPARRG